MVEAVGLLTPSNTQLLAQAFALYAESGLLVEEPQRFRSHFSRLVRIEFLGLW